MMHTTKSPFPPSNGKKAFWAKAVGVDTAWARGTETLESIRDRLDHFTQLLQERPGITPWKETHLYGPEWPTDPAGQLDAIRRRVMTNDDGEPTPEDGYLPSLAANLTDPSMRDLSLMFITYTGARVTNHPHTIEWARIRIGPDFFQPSSAPTKDITAPLAEDILQSTIIAWEPLYARLHSYWDSNEHSPYTRDTPKYGDWEIKTGYRLWLHDTIGPITHLAPDITATRFHTGTMLTAPDHWTPQHVGEAMFTTLDLNNINQLPHETHPHRPSTP